MSPDAFKAVIRPEGFTNSDVDITINVVVFGDIAAQVLIFLYSIQRVTIKGEDMIRTVQIVIHDLGLGDIHLEVGCGTGSTDGCYQFLKALRRSAGSCKVVCKLSISHIARWVPGAFPRYDFYPFFFDVVNTRSQDPVNHDVKQER